MEIKINMEQKEHEFKPGDCFYTPGCQEVRMTTIDGHGRYQTINPKDGTVGNTALTIDKLLEIYIGIMPCKATLLIEPLQE